MLGTALVEGADGKPLGGAATQRRLLALLSVLAVARDEGVTRDRILGILWAEAEPERARHALTQTLYHARRALDIDDLFVTGGGTVRLNGARVTSDLAEFDDAVAAGDLERAARLYRAPFLDGFYLSGSVGFDQWAATQRDRIGASAARVLGKLADAAAVRRERAEEVRWRRRLVELDPFDSGRTAGLMSALAAAGDHAGALLQARVHAELLRQELEIAPAAQVLALEARLREEAGRARVPDVDVAPAIRLERPADSVALLEPPAADPATDVGGLTDLAADAAAPGPRVGRGGDEPEVPRATEGATVVRPGQPRVSVPRPASAASRWAAVGAAALLLVAALAAAWRTRWPAPAERPQLGRASVVVAPFRVTGADASLGFLREGMIELLAVRMADDSLSRMVDPGPILRAWRAQGVASDPDASRAEIVARAATLGAERVIVGSVIGNPARIVLRAAVVTVADRQAIAEASVEGTIDSLTLLVDRLAVRLLAAGAGEDDRLTSLTTTSIPALRAYLGAQTAYRRGDYLEAMQGYEAALARDTGFALAALRLALAADRVNDAEQHDRAVALAWRARAELTTEDRAHLVALAGPRYPEPSTEAEFLGAWQEAAAVAPDRADVWYELAERYLRTGAVLGLDGPARAAGAARRALALDSGHLATRELLALVAARVHDTATLARLAPGPAARDSAAGLSSFARWRVDVAQGDRRVAARWATELPRHADATLRLIAMATLYDGLPPEHGERALRIRELRARRVADLTDVLLAQHSMAMNAGRPVQALDATERLEELRPGTRAHLRLRVLDALYGDGDRGAARDAARRLEAAAPALSTTGLALADACVLEQWRVTAGSRGATSRVIAHLRAAGALPETVLIGASPTACADLLEAQIAVAERRRDARSRVARLDSLMLAGPAIGDAGTYAHLVVARLYLALGEREAALAAVRRRGYMSGWPRYLASARLLEGRIAAELGDPRGRDVLERYLALRERPEPPLAPQVAEARALARRAASR